MMRANLSFAHLALTATTFTVAQTPVGGGQCTTCSASTDVGCWYFPIPAMESCAESGSFITIDASKCVTIGGAYDICGVSLELSGTFCLGASHNMATPPCSTCRAMMCFPDATLTKTTCERWVCDEWERIGELGECRWLRVCVRGHYESYTTTSINYGTPVVSVDCVDSSCVCRSHGFLNCNCPTTPAPTTPTPVTGAFPFGTTELSFSLSQLANIGNSIDPTALNAITDLSLSQLRELSSIMEDTIDTRGLNRAELEIVHRFMDGHVESWSHADWQVLVNNAVSLRQFSLSRADVNMDGIVYFDDITEQFLQLDAPKVGTRGFRSRTSMATVQ